MRAVVTAAALLVVTPSFAQRPPDLWHQQAEMPGLIWGSKIVIEDLPCCEAAKGTPSDSSSEATVLAAEPRRAFRDGPVLKLDLMGGRSLKITDCDQASCDNNEYRRHRLVAWWPLPGIRYYVVAVGLYEGHMAYLIRETDGLVVRLPAAPVLSPNARYAIAWAPSFDDSWMQFLDMNSYPPTIHNITLGAVCHDRSERTLPGLKPVWLGDTQVIFDDSELLVSNSPRFRMTLRIATDLNLRWECQL